MADARSPYAPGYGVPPPLLAGRTDIFKTVEDAFSEASAGRVPPAIMLTGARGFGKTVLLAEVARRADERDWPCVHVEARSQTPLGTLLAHECGQAASRLKRGRVLSRLRPTEASVQAQPVGVGVGARWSRGRPEEDPDPAGGALRELARRAGKRDMIAVLTVDEAQLAQRGGLEDLGAALQALAREEQPLVAVLAGLPSLESSQTVPTYLDSRASWLEVGPLSEREALTALTEPALQAGRPFEPDAAAMLARHAAGYPYAVQLAGKHAWESSEGRERIDVAAAVAAATATDGELGKGHERLLRRASPREREYLACLAACLAEDGRATGGMVARRLGVSATELSPVRARLLDRGTLFARDEELVFAVPGMAEHVRDRLHAPPASTISTPLSAPSRPRSSPPGCSWRCYTSTAPASSCRCACKGASHGKGAAGMLPAASRDGQVIDGGPPQEGC